MKNNTKSTSFNSKKRVDSNDAIDCQKDNCKMYLIKSGQRKISYCLALGYCRFKRKRQDKNGKEYWGCRQNERRNVDE